MTVAKGLCSWKEVASYLHDSGPVEIKRPVLLHLLIFQQKSEIQMLIFYFTSLNLIDPRLYKADLKEGLW